MSREDVIRVIAVFAIITGLVWVVYSVVTPARKCACEFERGVTEGYNPFSF
ncbi:hypothetical protein HZC00_00610 [Candidatus Kaiserbacteria bacterium]|nr:hypothetical protein [Candidatus Kaiserbacteria bacterium]